MVLPLKLVANKPTGDEEHEKSKHNRGLQGVFRRIRTHWHIGMLARDTFNTSLFNASLEANAFAFTIAILSSSTCWAAVYFFISCFIAFCPSCHVPLPATPRPTAQGKYAPWRAVVSFACCTIIYHLYFPSISSPICLPQLHACLDLLLPLQQMLLEVLVRAQQPIHQT